jgi:phosphonate transport system substrate-binding protein
MTLLVALLAACDSGSPQERVVVDFSGPTLAREAPPLADDLPVLRAAVGAMISPKETYSLYHELFQYLSERVGRQLVFVQRKTYEEVNTLFGSRELDVGFVCSGPYASGGEVHDFELLATPEVDGSHFYRSYLIVGKDSPFRSLEDLQGRSFAFTDPHSNTGYTVPLYWLHQEGRSIKEYFSGTMFTYSHDNSILAVARGLVDGACVDSLIWEYLAATSPEITDKTRIIRISDPFGIPPLVASRHLDPLVRQELRDALLEMHLDPQGQEILRKLMIERFILPEDAWYDSIREMMESLP